MNFQTTAHILHMYPCRKHRMKTLLLAVSFLVFSNLLIAFSLIAALRHPFVRLSAQAREDRERGEAPAWSTWHLVAAIFGIRARSEGFQARCLCISSGRPAAP